MATQSVGAEERLKALAIKLPPPPEPFGAHAEAVQTGDLLFLSRMLPTEGRTAKFTGRMGVELDAEGVASLPLGTPVELEVIFELAK